MTNLDIDPGRRGRVGSLEVTKFVAGLIRPGAHVVGLIPRRVCGVRHKIIPTGIFASFFIIAILTGIEKLLREIVAQGNKVIVGAGFGLGQCCANIRDVQCSAAFPVVLDSALPGGTNNFNTRKK